MCHYGLATTEILFASVVAFLSDGRCKALTCAADRVRCAFMTILLASLDVYKGGTHEVDAVL